MEANTLRWKDIDGWNAYSVSSKGDNACSFENPRDAFARLINKVSKKDVWSENPYVFVYDFELVK